MGVIAVVIVLTGLVSNTACAALLVAIVLGVTTAIALGASCAFMLTVATPPNAVVFGTAAVTATAMMRCGLVLNLVCTGVIVAVATALA